MIELTKLNNQKIILNSDLIEHVEALPDSLIKMTTGLKIMVKESIPEIIGAVIEFRRSIRREVNIHAVKDFTGEPAERILDQYRSAPVEAAD